MRNNNIFDFTTFPELIIERLVLRKLCLSDAAYLLVFRGDWEVQKYNGPVLQTIEEAQSDIEGAHTEYHKQEGINWAVTFKDADTVLGSFAFHHWSHNHRRAEVGYDLAHAYWGQGIASETLRDFYPDLADYVVQCRFSDCTHSHEPGCAMQTAVAEQKINAWRFKSYTQLFEKLA